MIYSQKRIFVVWVCLRIELYVQDFILEFYSVLCDFFIGKVINSGYAGNRVDSFFSIVVLKKLKGDLVKGYIGEVLESWFQIFCVNRNWID